jgi:response regulator RpfG family c-di-GMP phosphodiesterase
VRVFLLRAIHIAGREEASQQGISDAGAKEIILVVDDDPSVLETTRSILDDLGYRAIAANDAEAALVAVSHQAVDLALGRSRNAGDDGTGSRIGTATAPTRSANRILLWLS